MTASLDTLQIPAGFLALSTRSACKMTDSPASKPKAASGRMNRRPCQPIRGTQRTRPRGRHIEMKSCNRARPLPGARHNPMASSSPRRSSQDPRKALIGMVQRWALPSGSMTSTSRPHSRSSPSRARASTLNGEHIQCHSGFPSLSSVLK